MKNKMHVDYDGYVFECEIPFKPANGDYLIMSGKNTEDKTREILVEVYGLVYNATKGYWTLNQGLQDWHKNRKELSLLGSIAPRVEE